MKKIILLILLIIPLIVNSESSSNLIINNIQNSNEEITYTYNIHIDGVSGSTLIKIDDNSDYYIFDSLNNLLIEVLSNQTLTIENLPNNANYKISVEKIDGYNIKINNIETNEIKGTLEENTIINITSFTNKEIIVDDKKLEDVKVNPRTSDSIALLGLLCLFAMLIFYSLIKYKRML